MLDAIKIGGIRYDIQMVHDLRDEEDTKLDGRFAQSNCLISLNTNLAPQARYQTLWHEIVHGIIAHAGMRDQHDEVLIEALAHGIMQVLLDNPGVESLESGREL